MAAKEDIAGTQAELKRARKAADAVVDARPVVERLYSLWHDMRAAGWQDMIYAPKDGTEIEIIEMGSTGIFKAVWCSFGHEPLDDCGCFFSHDGDDSYPTRGVMWRRIKAKPSKGCANDGRQYAHAPTQSCGDNEARPRADGAGTAARSIRYRTANTFTLPCCQKLTSRNRSPP